MRRSPSSARREWSREQRHERRSRVDCRRVEGLTGKRVVVTGGTSGIGEATSRRFLDEGARVLALAVGEEEVATAAERIPGVHALLCDVADAAAVEHAFSTIDELLGGIDVLVANAG